MEPQHQLDVVFGRRLRDLREHAGLTQQDLADAMCAAGSKMYRSTIGKIEAGERVVSIGEATQFADVLGVGLTELVGTRDSRLFWAQVKVRSLERRAEEHSRQLHETQVLLDDTLARLEDAREQLKSLGG